MRPFSSPINEVNITAKLADMKDEQYRTLLALSTMMEILIDKGVITREEIEKKSAELDQFINHSPYPKV